MKKLLLPYLLLVLTLTGYAQNNPPVVEIVNVTVDEQAQNIHMVYHLQDAENDLCEVWVKATTQQAGFFEMVHASHLSGDVGAQISPGNGHSIVWHYDSLTLPLYNMHLGIYASDGKPMDIQSMVDQVDSVKLLENLMWIEGVRHYIAGPAHLNDVRDSLENIFTRHSLETQRLIFPYSTTQGQNITGRKAGYKDEGKTYIVCGHYDGVPGSPAADDNGSAVTGVLEILRILSPYTFEHSIRFIGFDFEELGIIGSQRYVQNQIEPYENIEGVLNFEMIGYYDQAPNTQSLPSGFNILFPQQTQAIQADSSRGNFLISCGNTTSSSLITAFENASAQYVPGLKLISLEVPGNGQVAPDLRRSDHAPFWDAGKKALMITDGADSRNHHYHTPGDSIGTLNFGFMAKNVKATLATLATLAIPISAGSDFFDLSILDVPESASLRGTEIEVYPNPFRGSVSISVNLTKPVQHTLEIYSLAGEKIYAETILSPAGLSEVLIELPEAKNGVYLLVLRSPEGNLVKKLIKIQG